MAPKKARVDYDQCDPRWPFERYDHNGVGTSIESVLVPAAERERLWKTAIAVHNFHDWSGSPKNLTASKSMLRELLSDVVNKGIGETISNVAGYYNIGDGPELIGVVARLLRKPIAPSLLNNRRIKRVMSIHLSERVVEKTANLDQLRSKVAT